jgi:hypothetical protein
MATNINQMQDVVLVPTCPYCEVDLTTVAPRSWSVGEAGGVVFLLCSSCMKVLGTVSSSSS